MDSLGPVGDAVLIDVPDELPVVRVDPGLLERVLGNLLENAVRFSATDRPAELTVRACDGAVLIPVVDHGPGLAESERERMFMPFQRLGDTSNTAGVGLGLAVGPGLRRGDAGNVDAAADAWRRAEHGCVASAGWCIEMRVLAVDDDPHILRALRINLQARGHQVLTAGSGTQALVIASRHPPDLVLLDLGLPDMDGVEVISGLRGWTSVPIIVLSGRADGTDKVEALDAGADDYVTKPFGMEELLARIRATVRRATPDAAPSKSGVRIGEHMVDLAAHQVMRGDGQEVRLTKTEWQLLERLVRQSGRLVTQRQLLSEVWGPGYAEESGYLRFHFAQLRRKLETDPGRPRHLITEPGIGYRFLE